MSPGTPFEVKGWCPGALTPMLSGDGLVARVRPVAARLSPEQVRVIGDIARRYGNGVIELTRRANVQIRGLVEGNLEVVQSLLLEARLLDPSPEVERRRNIISSPLDGIDPDCLPTQALETELRHALAEAEDLAALPAKFGFVINGGGVMTLDGVAADIRLDLFQEAGKVACLLSGPGLETPARLPLDQVVEAIIKSCRFFIKNTPQDTVKEKKIFPGNPLEIHAGTHLGPLPGTNAFAIAAPFGSLTLEQWEVLENSSEEVRITPWRSGVLSRFDRDSFSSFKAVGWINDPSDPRLNIVACSGAPACASAVGDTRHLANQLAELSSDKRARIHISGCPKSCAASESFDVAIVAVEGGYRLATDTTIRDIQGGLTHSAEEVPAALTKLTELDRI